MRSLNSDMRRKPSPASQCSGSSGKGDAGGSGSSYVPTAAAAGCQAAAADVRQRAAAARSARSGSMAELIADSCQSERLRSALTAHASHWVSAHRARQLSGKARFCVSCTGRPCNSQPRPHVALPPRACYKPAVLRTCCLLLRRTCGHEEEENAQPQAGCACRD